MVEGSKQQAILERQLAQIRQLVRMETEWLQAMRKRTNMIFLCSLRCFYKTIFFKVLRFLKSYGIIYSVNYKILIVWTNAALRGARRSTGCGGTQR